MAEVVLPARRDPRYLADSIASSLVLACDPAAQAASPAYWERAKNAHQEVLGALDGLPAPHVAALRARLAADPSNAAVYRSLVAALAEWLSRSDGEASHLTRVAWRADCVSRLRVHTGSRLPDSGTGPVGIEELRHISPPRRLVDRYQPDAVVIIPFRECDPSGHRARNLLACLHALGRQSCGRDQFQVVVVESDRQPRWRHLIEPFADTYLFAANGGPFNKSWAVNAGVVHAAGAAELICVLDGDIVVDDSFIQRNADRFERPGAQAHWPARNVLFLDGPSSATAIRYRCLEGRSNVDPSLLRGVFLRRPPGGSIWLRRELYDRVGGMDERFEGWGGEDRDFAFRLDHEAGVDRYDDALVHLVHPPAPAAMYGRRLWAAFHWASWPPDAEMGRLDKYS